jgi:hypothetical protein
MQKTRFIGGRCLLLPSRAILLCWGALSLVTGSNAAMAPGFSTLRNTIDIMDLSFDTMTNSMKVKWTLDTSGAAGGLLDVGIFWSMTAYPMVIMGPPDTVKLNTQPLDSVSLPVGEKLMFDTTYYFTLSLRRRLGTWFAATDSSRKTANTPPFTWQAVKYGIGFPTAYANRGTIRISVDPLTFQTGVDNNRIVRWTPPTTPPGFIPVSMGFEFYSKYQSLPLKIGIKYGPLPSGHSRDEIKIYRYKNGMWLFDRSPLEKDVQGYASVTTGDIFYPFIAMIDLQPPTVTVISHPDKAVVNGKPVADTFTITDNISNVAWKFHFARAGDPFDDAPGDSATLVSSFENITTVIPGNFVSADQGVRAMLSVSDGANEVVRNVSRRVIRNIGGSDVVSLDSMKWVPLCVTAQLDSPQARRALQAFSVNGTWTYDITKFRLFRWIAASGASGNGAGEYVEYSDTGDSLFYFAPGKLFWVKTRRPVVIDFGRGTTPELTQPAVVTLRPHAWTDFALPYYFNIKIGDIIDATTASGQLADSLRFCGWLRDSAKGYTNKEVFTPQLGVKGLRDLSTILAAKQSDGVGAGYSVFNQSAVEVKLSIPPIPASMSKYIGSTVKKTEIDGCHSIKISSRAVSGAVLNDVYCVYGTGEKKTRYLPAAPSLGEGVTVRVCDGSMRSYGHVISATQSADDGISCNLAFDNTSDKDQIIEMTVSGLETLHAVLFNPASGAFIEAPPHAKDHWRIMTTSGSQTVVQFLAGSDAYVAKAKIDKKSSKAALIGVYSKSFGHSLIIRFSLPAIPIIRAVFAFFDMQGRQLWRASHLGREGINEIVYPWIGRAAPGTYLLQMKTCDARGNVSAVFEKKLIRMY